MISEILMIILLIVAGYYLITVVFGYELTEQDIQEGTILQLFIEWKIENTVCSEIYGGIDGSNGEPQK